MLLRYIHRTQVGYLKEKRGGGVSSYLLMSCTARTSATGAFALNKFQCILSRCWFCDVLLNIKAANKNLSSQYITMFVLSIYSCLPYLSWVNSISRQHNTSGNCKTFTCRNAVGSPHNRCCLTKRKGGGHWTKPILRQYRWRRLKCFENQQHWEGRRHHCSCTSH